MNLLQRIRRIFRSRKLPDFGRENGTTKQAWLELYKELAAEESRLAAMVSNYTEIKEKAVLWEKTAREAAGSGKDELAKEALTHKEEAEKKLAEFGVSPELLQEEMNRFKARLELLKKQGGAPSYHLRGGGKLPDTPGYPEALQKRIISAESLLEARDEIQGLDIPASLDDQLKELKKDLGNGTSETGSADTRSGGN